MRRSFGDGLRGRDGVTPSPSALATFLDALWSIGGSGNFRALWLPTAADTTTNTDPSSPSRIWTYDADISARISTQGNGVVVSFNGTSQYLTTPDTADLSFGNSLVDSPFSISVLANVTNTAARRDLIGKWNTSNNEFILFVTTADKLSLSLADNSVPAFPNRTSNAAITQGALHLFGASYSGVGGATALNGATLLEDGAVITSAASNDPNYVAIQNGTATPDIGHDLGGTTYFQGTMGFAAIWAVNLSTAQHLQIKVAVNTYFGTSL